MRRVCPAWASFASDTPEQTVLEMRPGERLTLLTDGVVEARDEHGSLFGSERASPSSGIRRRSLSRISALHHGQEDDLTVISILRKP